MADGLKNIQNKLNKGNLRKGAVLLFLIVVFTAIFFVGGVQTYPDTDSYLKMSPIREPGYALVLKGVTALFGERGFFILGFLQNALAVFAVYMTSCYIGSKFKEKFVFFLAAFCMLLPYVVTPMFAASGIILTNAMISEGIALSLYNLYFLYLLKAVWETEKKQKFLLIALGLAFFMSLLRGQMMVTLIAWVITAAIVWIKEKNFRKTCGMILLFVLVMMARVVSVNSYNLLANGRYAGTTYGDVTILSNVIYVAEREDGEAIGDDNLRRLFYEIYEVAESGNMLLKDAPEDFTGEAGFYSEKHDDIKDFGIYPILQSYVEKEEGITDYMDKCIRVDELASSMTKGLLAECGEEWVKHYLANVAVGMIRTVAFVHPLLNIPSFIGYAVLIVAGIFLFVKKKDSKAVSMLLLTALLTAGNVAAVAITIMCLSRYMIYNMAFVYISGILLVVEIFREIVPKIGGRKECECSD